MPTDFGLTGYEEMTDAERLKDYREFMYEKVALETAKGAIIDDTVIEKERTKNYEVTEVDKWHHYPPVPGTHLLRHCF